MLAQLETAEVELDRHRRGIAGTIAIGTFQSMTAVVLPTTISHFRREAPDIEIRLVQEDPLTNYLDLLFTGELDACLTVGPTPDSVNSLLLGLDPHVAVVDPSTPAGPVDTYSFSGQPMIGQPKTDACQQLVDTELERLGITSNYVFNSYDNGAVQAMVGAGMGIAIMPLLTVDPGDTSVAIRQLDPPLEPRMISVVWDKDRTPSAATERFIEIMASVCEQKLAHAAEVGPRR